MYILQTIRETNPTLAENLEAFAYESSIAFCYPCYVEAIDSNDGPRCPKCHSDDLARLLCGVGVDWGVLWILEHIVTEKVPAVNIDEMFEDHVSDCYGGDCQIGWLNIDVAHAIKNLDAVSWRIAKSEYADSLIEDGELVEGQDGNYYWVSDLEKHLL
ncbi:MAG: hypothetical protein KDD35_03995 [Bdellovibrionales bacterium]|nr:hypothetical protein [Bdellovibrionales bacterium]